MYCWTFFIFVTTGQHHTMLECWFSPSCNWSQPKSVIATGLWPAKSVEIGWDWPTEIDTNFNQGCNLIATAKYNNYNFYLSGGISRWYQKGLQSTHSQDSLLLHLFVVIASLYFQVVHVTQAHDMEWSAAGRCIVLLTTKFCSLKSRDYKVL